MNIFTGNSLQIFYTADTGNNSPSFGGFKEVTNVAEFPTVTQSNQSQQIETFDSDYATVLMGDKSTESLPITLNYVINDESHIFLETAAEQQNLIQLKLKINSDENQETYYLINGYVQSYQTTGDKDSVVQRSYSFVPETIVSQGVADILPVLHQGDFGVGSNGIDTPQYTPSAGASTGNGFIQIPSNANDNPAGSNLIGVGLTNNNNEAGFVISETGDLRLYARNQSTAWTRIYSSTEADSRYVQRTVTVNGYPLTGNIDLVKGDVGLGNVTNNAQLTISSNLSDLSNVGTAKTNLGLDNVLNVPSFSKTEADSRYVQRTVTVNGHELSTDIVLQPSDIGSYSKDESDDTFVQKTLKVNGHELSTDIVLQPSDIGIIPVANGGTGATTVSTARTALGLGVSNDVTHRNLSLINSGSDAIVSLNGSIIRGDSNNALIIGSTGGFFIRPKGDGTASPQLSFDANGVFSLISTNVNIGGTLSTTGTASIGGTLSVTGSSNNFINVGGGTIRGTSGAAASVVISSSGTGGIHFRPKGDLDQTSSVVYGQDGVILHTAAPLKLDTTSILTLGTPLTITSGGTGANNAAGARTNLGLAYGTSAGTVVQGNDTRLNTVNEKSGGKLIGGLGVLNGTANVDLKTAGTYLLWNEQPGTGVSSLINNPDSGAGGFWIRLINSANTVERARFTFSPDSTLLAPEGFRSVGGRVRAFASVTPTYVTIDVDGINKGINFFDSDIRLKENISPIVLGTALDKLNLIEPVSYKFKDTYWTDQDDIKHTMQGKSYSYGVIAQNIIDVIPDCVNVMDDDRGSMSLDPLAMIGFLLAATKDLAAEVESLKQQLNK